jgi:tetratricopeptide (TPR) repeat protein
MTTGDQRARKPRTVLELKIWQRNQSLAEFVKSAEEFARECGEPGTLSERHLKRLVAGQATDGSPVGRPRPATARLLEQIFSLGIKDLLAPPETLSANESDGSQLRLRLDAARRLDPEVLAVLRDQLNNLRRIDRQLGAVTAHDEVVAKIEQISLLQSHCLNTDIRTGLATLLAELGTLAGWQALDLGRVAESWRHYERAKSVALQSGNPRFEVHTTAEQSFALLAVGETNAAVEVLAATEARARHVTDRLLRSWLAAAHGEALAAAGKRSASLRAFDRAASLLPSESSDADGPYVVLDPVHLARWRGHALARTGAPEAIDILTSALNRLDPTFARAETGLRVDLASAFVTKGAREEAKVHVTKARALAVSIGSTRQLRRLKELTHAMF